MSKKEVDLFKRAIQANIKNEEGYSLSLDIIDVHTGEEDENTYKIINNLLIRAGGSKGFPKFLNYQMCCKELDRIDRIINRNKDSILFLEGI